MIKRAIAIGALIAGTLALAGCIEDEAYTASYNTSKAADNFEIERRIVFFNGITDKYLLEVTGYCSIEDQKTQLEVICKNGQGEYSKEFLGLSDNVSYFVQQLRPSGVSGYHRRVVFRPQTILPDIDIKVSGSELKNVGVEVINGDAEYKEIN